MKIFACVCQQLLFFESVSCTRCGRTLAFLPDRLQVAALEPVEGEDGVYRSEEARYRLCRNYTEEGVCNWAVPASDEQGYCRSCRLNHVIPNLSHEGAKEAWHQLEIAKRRLLYTLIDMGLPVESKSEDPTKGLAFQFLEDEPAGKVFTGHDSGVITINVAEADDPFREKMRVQMGEAYRTLLGHFRHEIGHHYWNRLIQDSDWLPRFRERFGDERADYAASQVRHYDQGPAGDWASRFVSAYASMHPWEDWAETWAHYLHMTDTFETARAYGLVVRPRPATEAARPPVVTPRLDPHRFEDLIAGWVPLTMALNSLNRSMGLPDIYPFVLSEKAIAKLRFVHQVIEETGAASAASEAAAPGRGPDPGSPGPARR
jgi:hypothetical protein